ncbi:MAG TPA: DUF2169 domain-containing protein, partial [Candidatus Sulfotelmatobacter sp.]|nr:DUF2169 domain-containing protein [Candidatus Sulfotelmatobacter sp.]
MKVENQTGFPVQVMPGFGPDDRTVLTLVLKGTFEIVPGGAAKPAEQPEPIAFADVLAEGPRGPVPQVDSDLAPFKPRADVLLVGTARAPKGRPVTQLDVGLKLGRLEKIVRVFGERRWDAGGFGRDPRPSDPKPFAECDLSYAMAFGGVDDKSGGASTANPIGLGFIAEKAKKSAVEGVPLPRLENPAELIESWKDRPAPFA